MSLIFCRVGSGSGGQNSSRSAPCVVPGPDMQLLGYVRANTDEFERSALGEKLQVTQLVLRSADDGPNFTEDLEISAVGGSIGLLLLYSLSSSRFSLFWLVVRREARH